MKRMSCVEIFNTLFEKTDTDSANNYELTKALSLYSIAASMATLTDSMTSKENKIGHWTYVDGTHNRCSQCHSIFEITSPEGEFEGECNYCPNCGAKMEVDK